MGPSGIRSTSTTKQDKACKAKPLNATKEDNGIS